MKKGFCPDGTRSRVVKMKMLSRYQSASIFQPGGAYIAKERWAHSGRLTGVAVPATSGSFLSSRYPTQLLPFHRSMEPPQMRTNFSPILFSLSLLPWRGEGKKNAKLVTIANHGLDSNPCRLRMEGVLNGYKTTDVEFFASKSPLAVLAAASHSSSFPFSLSLPPSSPLERTAPTKLDKLGWGKVSRGGTTRENFIPSGVTVRTRFRSKGNADGFSYFRSRNGYRSFREIGHSYPDLVRRRRGKERPGAGLLKFFIVALFPFGQEARLRKTPKASISRKLGRARLEKVARSETAVGENESREKGREKAREEGRTVEKMARDDAFQPSSNRGRNHSKSSRAIQQ